MLLTFTFDARRNWRKRNGSTFRWYSTSPKYNRTMYEHELSDYNSWVIQPQTTTCVDTTSTTCKPRLATWMLPQTRILHSVNICCYLFQTSFVLFISFCYCTENAQLLHKIIGTVAIVADIFSLCEPILSGESSWDSKHERKSSTALIAFSRIWPTSITRWKTVIAKIDTPCCRSFRWDQWNSSPTAHWLDIEPIESVRQSTKKDLVFFWSRANPASNKFLHLYSMPNFVTP